MSESACFRAGIEEERRESIMVGICGSEEDAQFMATMKPMQREVLGCQALLKTYSPRVGKMAQRLRVPPS